MAQATEKHVEPEWMELLSDPVMLAVLKRDGLTVDDVKKVVQSYQRNQRPRTS
jgi:urease accessory protein UreE